MAKRIFISCDEATTICDKSQYGEATFFEKMTLQLHFLRCKLCALYSRQNNLLTKLYQQKAHEERRKNHCLSDAEKKDLREKLEKMHS